MLCSSCRKQEHLVCEHPTTCTCQHRQNAQYITDLKVDINGSKKGNPSKTEIEYNQGDT